MGEKKRGLVSSIATLLVVVSLLFMEINLAHGDETRFHGFRRAVPPSPKRNLRPTLNLRSPPPLIPRASIPPPPSTTDPLSPPLIPRASIPPPPSTTDPLSPPPPPSVPSV